MDLNSASDGTINRLLIVLLDSLRGDHIVLANVLLLSKARHCSRNYSRDEKSGQCGHSVCRCVGLMKIQSTGCSSTSTATARLRVTCAA
jgi:hypothetical protein